MFYYRVVNSNLKKKKIFEKIRIKLSKQSILSRKNEDKKTLNDDSNY